MPDLQARNGPSWCCYRMESRTACRIKKSWTSRADLLIRREQLRTSSSLQRMLEGTFRFRFARACWADPLSVVAKTI